MSIRACLPFALFAALASSGCSSAASDDGAIDEGAAKIKESVLEVEGVDGVTLTRTTPKGGFQEEHEHTFIGAPSKVAKLFAAVTAEGAQRSCPAKGPKYDLTLVNAYERDVATVFSTCGMGSVSVKGGATERASVDEDVLDQLLKSKPMIGDAVWAVNAVRLYAAAAVPTGFKELGYTTDRKGLRREAPGDIYVEDLVAPLPRDREITAPSPTCKVTHRVGIWRGSREVVNIDVCGSAGEVSGTFKYFPEGDSDKPAAASGGIKLDVEPFMKLARRR